MGQNSTTHRVPLPGARTPVAGFDAPFDMLTACHERVEWMLMLMLLTRLQQHLVASGCDLAAAQAAHDVTRYFDLAGPAHHEDEERHVFPDVENQSPCTAALVAQLRAQHQSMTQQWHSLRRYLQRVVQERLTERHHAPLERRIRAFAQLYRGHIALEESQLYPAARALMDDKSQATMGWEMAHRRGAHLSRP